MMRRCFRGSSLGLKFARIISGFSTLVYPTNSDWLVPLLTCCILEGETIKWMYVYACCDVSIIVGIINYQHGQMWRKLEREPLQQKYILQAKKVQYNILTWHFQNAICIHWKKLPTHQHPAAATIWVNNRPADTVQEGTSRAPPNANAPKIERNTTIDTAHHMSLPLFWSVQHPGFPPFSCRQSLRSPIPSIPTCEVCGIIPTHHHPLSSIKHVPWVFAASVQSEEFGFVSSRSSQTLNWSESFRKEEWEGWRCSAAPWAPRRKPRWKLRDRAWQSSVIFC